MVVNSRYTFLYKNQKWCDNQINFSLKNNNINLYKDRKNERKFNVQIAQIFLLREIEIIANENSTIRKIDYLI